MKQFTLIILLFLGLGISLLGQNSNSFEQQYFRKARIKTTDSVHIKVSKLFVFERNISYTSPSTMQKMSIPIEKISSIKYKKGTYMGEGGLIGGLLFGLAGVYYARLTYDEYAYDDNSVPKVVGFTIGGIIIGGVVGNSIPKWKIYNTKKQEITSIKPDLLLGKGFFGLKLALSIPPR